MQIQIWANQETLKCPVKTNLLSTNIITTATMRRYITVFALLVLITACSAQVNTIADVINNNPSFSTLSSLLTAANLQYTLSQPDSYTLFAPNNTAFKALPSYVINTLLKPENSNLLQSVLLYHVLPGIFNTFDIIQLDNRTLVSAQGSTIALDIRSAQKTFLQGVISLNDARVIQANIPASNGVIHSLDRVLIADLWQFVSPYPNIFGLISQNPALSTLTYALKATGLDQVLTQSKGTYTVFAPTNDAFEDPLLAPLFGVNSRDALKQVLLYHVLGMPVYSTQLYDGLVAPTAQGATVTVRRNTFLTLATTTVNDALILTTDTTAYNGVIHTIDRVLLPYTY